MIIVQVKEIFQQKLYTKYKYKSIKLNIKKNKKNRLNKYNQVKLKK